jgi:glycosyltransferase involved in cell wall biosynthesis
VNSPFYICWQPGLINWLEEWKPDVLIIEANPRYPANRRAVQWMHIQSRPVIGWGLGAPPLKGFLGNLRDRTRRRFLRSLDGILSYSRKGAAEYSLLGIPEDHIFVATNAVVRAPPHPPPKRPGEYIGRPNVLFVGRLQARKRIDNLLKACSQLPEGLQPNLWIIGDGLAKEELEARAADLYPQTEFTGALHGEELDQYFLKADIFVLPGTGGLAVQQAMSFALPVIMAEGDGTQDDMIDQANGWRVMPGNAEELRSILEEALSDPQRLREMGNTSFRYVKEKINIDSMVDVFIDAVRKVEKVSV